MLAKWNPFADAALSPFISSSLLDDAAPPSAWAQESAYLPVADVVETQDELKLMMDLPGHDPKSLQVKLENDTLTVRSERRRNHEERKVGYLRTERAHGAFERSFVLPRSVDPSKCEARFDSGVLTLTVPKREEAKPRSIAIKLSS